MGRRRGDRAFSFSERCTLSLWERVRVGEFPRKLTCRSYYHCRGSCPSPQSSPVGRGRMKRPWTGRRGRRGRRGGARHGNCSADPAVHQGAGASPAIPEGQCWTPHPVRSSPTHGSGALCKAGRYCRELAESRVFVFRIHGRPSSLAARLPADHAEPRDAVGADAGAFRWFQAPTSLE